MGNTISAIVLAVLALLAFFGYKEWKDISPPPTPGQSTKSQTNFTSCLDETSSMLASIKPWEHNQYEWNEIRKTVALVEGRTDTLRLKSILSILKSVNPPHNKQEWGQIRNQASALFNELNDNNKDVTLKRMLRLLSSIHPHIDNKDEWQKIRDGSNRILRACY